MSTARSGPDVLASAGPRRLDVELARRGIARSREHAAELIAAHAVRVDGVVAAKPAQRVASDSKIISTASDPVYASRGGDKLGGALADLEPYGLAVAGRSSLDAGASTGGFTDVLLRAGASSVVAVDVGTDQLVPALRADPRVRVLDGTNVRDLEPGQVGGAVDVTVADLSFISLRLVLPALVRCTRADGDLVLMVKPQFEVGRGRVGPHGVVHDPELRAQAVRDVADAAARLGRGVRAASRSHRPGPAGNVEYFLWLQQNALAADDGLIDELITTGLAVNAVNAVDAVDAAPRATAGPR